MTALRIALILSITALTPLHVHAAGSSDTPASNVSECEEGQVYDKKAKECVDEEKSSMNDADLLDNGRALAYAERFDEAIAVLSKIEIRDAEVLNYLGYATRNAGDVEKGLSFYRAALDLDPDYTLARSYMGQALLNKGDRRGALIQLDEIEKRVGSETREYKMLAHALVQKSLRKTATY
ncbi:MAG: hypothetical protein AAF870_01585 [Pseudomonadota bacterium]